MILRIILLVGIAVCIYAGYLQVGYLTHFINYPENPVRHENLAGMFLVGAIYSIAWVSTFILATVKKDSFKKAERITAYIFSSLVAVGFLLSVVLDFAL